MSDQPDLMRTPVPDLVRKKQQLQEFTNNKKVMEKAGIELASLRV